MIKTLDEVLQRLIDIHDCKEEMCGCGIHLLMAEITEGMLKDEQPKDKLAQLRAENKRLHKALQVSAEINHGNALAYGHGHTKGNFRKCTNGYCMEATEALTATQTAAPGHERQLGGGASKG